MFFLKGQVNLIFHFFLQFKTDAIKMCDQTLYFQIGRCF